MNEKDKEYREKLMDFAVQIVHLKQYLNTEKHEYNIADQIQRSGTSIGAMQREASYAESDSDFIHKLAIAQKECSETLFWLELLYKTQYISEIQYKELSGDGLNIMRWLSAAIKTAKQKMTSA